MHNRLCLLGIYRLGNPIQVSVPGCPLGFFCDSGDLAVRHQPLFTIESEMPEQLIVFLNKLFQLGIHPGDLSFADRLDGKNL